MEKKEEPTLLDYATPTSEANRPRWGRRTLIAFCLAVCHFIFSLLADGSPRGHVVLHWIAFPLFCVASLFRCLDGFKILHHSFTLAIVESAMVGILLAAVVEAIPFLIKRWKV
jgi:hypothetical protein